MIVLSWSKGARDLLKSLGWGIRALHQLGTATMVPSPRRLPHTISPLEGGGFEPSVPRLRWSSVQLAARDATDATPERRSFAAPTAGEVIRSQWGTPLAPSWARPMDVGMVGIAGDE